MIVKPSLQVSKIVRTAETEIRQRATGVHEIESDDFSLETGQRDLVRILTGEGEIGNNCAHRNRFSCGSTCTIKQFQPTRSQRIRFQSLVTVDADSFSARRASIGNQIKFDHGAGTEIV